MLSSISIASLTASHFPAFSLLRSDGRQRNRFHGRTNNPQTGNITPSTAGWQSHPDDADNTVGGASPQQIQPNLAYRLCGLTYLWTVLQTNISSSNNSNDDRVVYLLHSSPAENVAPLFCNLPHSTPHQLAAVTLAWAETTLATDSPGRHQSHPILAVKVNLLDSSWSSQFVTITSTSHCGVSPQDLISCSCLVGFPISPPGYAIHRFIPMLSNHSHSSRLYTNPS